MFANILLKIKIKNSMNLKCFLLIVIGIFNFNNFIYSSGLFGNISKNITENRILYEIQKGNFEKASIRLKYYHLNYSENFSSQYLGYLIYSDRLNFNASSLLSYRYLFMAKENYKMLNYKQQLYFRKKYYVDEFYLERTIQQLRNTLISEFSISTDSIKTLINFLATENLKDELLKLALDKKFDELIFFELLKVEENTISINDGNKTIRKNSDIKSGCIIQLDKNLNNLSFVWSGECIDGFAEGEGECLFYRNNNLIYTYKGRFTKGKINDPVTIIYPNGTKYVGSLKNDKYFIGTYTFADGSIQSGYWVNGKLNGKGKSISKMGSIYEGEWKDGLKSGNGTLTISDGSKYIGTWIENSMSGPFTYYFANGTEFQGTMRNDTIEKKGVCKFQNGSIYTGDIKDFEFNGKGTFTRANGERYEGDWKNSKPHGYGIFVFADSSKYAGNWIEGERNGYGELIFKNGSKYIGQWKNNEMNGYGTMSMIEGETYSGEWKDGEKCGNGTYILIDGSKHVGYWNGKRMKYGRVYSPKGELVYDGDMENYYRQ